jgi:integrase
MAKHNGANERIKREYFRYLQEARGRDETTIDAVAKSLTRFEGATRGRDFKRFNREMAVAFKKGLAEANNLRTGERLSKATVLATLRDLRTFFFWLAHLPGYKAHIRYDDADYFNLSDKDTAIARARREQKVPTLDQVHHVLATMPAATILERRDRALVAFTALSAARVAALASFRMEHIDLAAGLVHQDARTVQTKFAKTFCTWFIPIGGDALEIVRDWVGELQRDHLWGPADPLFPSTRMGLSEGGGFVATGINRHGWATTQPIREIFKRAFAAAGLPVFNPHSFRNMLVQHAMTLGLSHEAMKAWSQNLGHADVLVTLTSYGTVPAHRQGELIKASGAPTQGPKAEQIAALETMLAAFKAGRGVVDQSESIGIM